MSQFGQLLTVLSALVALSGASKGRLDWEANAKRFSFAAPARLERPIRLRATAYIVQGATESTDPADPELIGPGGAALHIRIPLREWCLAADEGSLMVRRTTGLVQSFAYAGTGHAKLANCSKVFASHPPAFYAGMERSRFRPMPSDAPYGVGAPSQTYRLVPYRSIAVDKAASTPVHTGQVLFIPVLRDTAITLADGTLVKHDGYVMAVDAGSAIKGDHIDFFQGPRPNDHIVSALTKRFPAYVVNDPFVVGQLQAMHLRVQGKR